MAGKCLRWFREALGLSARGGFRWLRLSAVPIQVSSTGRVWPGIYSMRPTLGRMDVRQRSGVSCWPGAGTPAPFHAMLRYTRGTSMRGEEDYSSVSTQQPNNYALTGVGNHGILQTCWESERRA